jgi:predicted kinase
MPLPEPDQTIYTVLRRRQLSRHVPHNPAVIMFCGIPGSGKTTLAQRLTRDLQAQYIQNDAARELARQNGIKNFKPHEVSKALARTIYDEDANKLVVLDATIDRHWRDAIRFYRELGANAIIIRITIDPPVALARIEKRGRDDDPSLTEIIADRLANFEACKKELPADIELTVPYDYEQVLHSVRALL